MLGLDTKLRPEIPGVAGHWFTLVGAQLHLVDAPVGPRHRSELAITTAWRSTISARAIAELRRAASSSLRGAQGDVVQIWFCRSAGNVIELQQDAGV